MDMIDRFMLMVNDINELRKKLIPSPILLWKIYHRRYEIIKIINQDSYSIEDMINFSWILKYGYNKWGEDYNLLPETCIMRYFNDRCIFKYYGYGDEHRHNIMLTLDCLASHNRIDVFMQFVSDIDGKTYSHHSEIKSIEEVSLDRYYIDIIREAIKAGILTVIDKLIKGD